MQGTNHWFVAYDHEGELRVSVWNPRTRLRAGARHLCGHTCLHKLVDDFMARTLAVRIPSAASDSNAVPQKQQKIARYAAGLTDTNLTEPRTLHDRKSGPTASVAPTLDEFESSARLVAPPELGPSRRRRNAVSRVFSRSLHLNPPHVLAMAPIADTPSYSSRTWRAEAWKREREREERAAHHPPPTTRRRSNCLSHCTTCLTDHCLPVQHFISPASSSTGTFNSCALSSFDPASSPATT